MDTAAAISVACFPAGVREQRLLEKLKPEAIALQEPGWERLEEQAITAPELFMSCGTLQELLIVALRHTMQGF